MRRGGGVGTGFSTGPGQGANVHDLLSATKSMLARLDSRDMGPAQMLQVVTAFRVVTRDVYPFSRNAFDRGAFKDVFQ